MIYTVYADPDLSSGNRLHAFKYGEIAAVPMYRAHCDLHHLQAWLHVTGASRKGKIVGQKPTYFGGTKPGVCNFCRFTLGEAYPGTGHIRGRCPSKKLFKAAIDAAQPDALVLKSNLERRLKRHQSAAIQQLGWLFDYLALIVTEGTRRLLPDFEPRAQLDALLSQLNGRQCSRIHLTAAKAADDIHAVFSQPQ